MSGTGTIHKGTDSSRHDLPRMPNGKASAAAPKLSDNGQVELEDMEQPDGAPSPDEDIMQLARLGDIGGIQRLYNSGRFDASYCDAEGITPLHVWSSF